jgi:hypothetical protein
MVIDVLGSLALLAGIIIARLDLLCKRGRIRRITTTAPAVLDTVGTLALYALIIWGFFHMTWYVWLGIVLTTSVFGGLAVKVSNMGFWSGVAPVLQILIIAVSLYAWIAFWPF